MATNRIIAGALGKIQLADATLRGERLDEATFVHNTKGNEAEGKSTREVAFGRECWTLVGMDSPVSYRRRGNTFTYFQFHRRCHP